MPGKQKVSYVGLELEVIPSGKERGVYFTDEKPLFYLKIRNLTKKRISGELTWFYGFGSGAPENFRYSVINLTNLNPEETVEKEIMGLLLGFQGNGLIGIPTAPECALISSKNADETILKHAFFDAGQYHTLYTFTVMDREFYQQIYEYPTNIQKQVKTLTIILVFLTVVLLIDYNKLPLEIKIALAVLLVIITYVFDRK